MNEMKKLEQARERVIETLSQNMNLYGITPSVGRLYGAMYFYNKPLTLDEMAHILGMSKTSMSTSVRTLQDLNMVEKVWRKGTRKDLYKVEEDWFETFIDLFSIKWRNAVTWNVHAIQKSMQEMEELKEKEETSQELKTMIELDLEKLGNALEYYDWLNRLVDRLESKEIFEFVPKNPQKQ